VAVSAEDFEPLGLSSDLLIVAITQVLGPFEHVLEMQNAQITSSS
jgi:hypothetical protein